LNIFFYCNWSNQKEWLSALRKIFINENIVTLRSNPDLSKIEIAILWNIPNKHFKQLTNLKLIFSPGAGVDHILNLPSYNSQPIIRIKENSMAERMTNHVFSQILIKQLNLKIYFDAKKNKKWLGEINTELNHNITVGFLGLGYLGSFVAKKLFKMGYKIIGYKNSPPNKKFPFNVYYRKKDLSKFIKQSEILVNILPSTQQTNNLINKSFLKKMKKKALLINVGRGSTIDEKDLIDHLKKNKKFEASLDVFQNEPLLKSSPLWKLPNVTITPHVASITVLDTAVAYIYKKYCYYKKTGKIKSNVNLKKGY